MSEKYAIVRDGAVINLCEAEAGWQAPGNDEAVRVAGRECSIGWGWDGTDFLAPTPLSASERAARRRVHMSAYRRAFRAALAAMPATDGLSPHLLAQIDTAIALRPPYDDVREAWDTVTQFIRMHPDVAAWGAALGFDDAMLDAIFAAALPIEAGGVTCPTI